MDSRYRILTLGIPWTQSMPSRDVIVATRLAEASWRRDKVSYIRLQSYIWRARRQGNFTVTSWMLNTKELMHCHCGTNNRAPRWTFTDPCKPEMGPGAREESASPAWLAAPVILDVTASFSHTISYVGNVSLASTRLYCWESAQVECFPLCSFWINILWCDRFNGAKSFQIRQEIKKLEIIFAAPFWNGVLYRICSMTKMLFQFQKGNMVSCTLSGLNIRLGEYKIQTTYMRPYYLSGAEIMHNSVALVNLRLY